MSDQDRGQGGKSGVPPIQPKPATQPRPPGQSRGSLFGQAGPVNLSTGRKDTLVLGDLAKPHEQPVASPPAPEGDSGMMSGPMSEAFVRSPELGALTELSRKMPSPSTSWSPTPWRPRIESSSYVHPLGAVSGNVQVGKEVFVAAGAVIRGDNEEPIFIGDECNIQEGAILRDLPTVIDGKRLTQRVVDVGNDKYSLYLAGRVSIAPQAQVHGPAYIAEGVYVGMQSLVFWARIEAGVVIEPGCLIMNVTIPSGVFVPAGLKVTTQSVVKDLPPLTEKYRFRGIGEETVACNREMLKGHRSLSR